MAKESLKENVNAIWNGEAMKAKAAGMTVDVTLTMNARPVLVKVLLNNFDNYRYFIM